MKTYIFTIQFFDGDMNMEYSVIDAVFANVEDAKAHAMKRIKEQKYFWKDSWLSKICKGKVALRGGINGCSKVYHIQEMEVR